MNIKDRFFTFEKYKIYSEKYETLNAKGVVILIHGFRHYSGCLKEMAEFLYQEKYSVVLLDLIGHGKSSGEPRTWIDSINTHVNSVNFCITEIQKENKDLPIFVIGHSMGGLVTSILARERKDLKGCVALAPAFYMKPHIMYFLSFLIVAILFFAPLIMLPVPPNDKFFPDEESKRKMHNDKYVWTDKLALNTSFQLMKTGKEEVTKDITIPFLLLHGDSDMLVDVKGSQLKSKHLTNKHSKYVEFKNLNHILYLEHNKLTQFKLIVDFLDDVLRK
ncbi:monoglyceride lipase, putative [Entamoeba invadens IP1]|uniref:monoglyceride lipase, putative n=1 Tax=Entamoeba invadens IP1 TaxID=370355 RepID=UPI0002C3EA14|nr:monoglyceride lipase, putative [Entamoeba invadens IP1]ELP93146.1 monoglyceride lipase, putative [Entamoeba invadens IP1]|eukprot:XP_004259917.1 monoglyceride lipase, putative [Entamoeba invadens IP1]